jgi:hypothetical protein
MIYYTKAKNLLLLNKVITDNDIKSSFKKLFRISNILSAGTAGRVINKSILLIKQLNTN